MPGSNARIENLVKKLKTNGHRVTPQRVAILKAICTDRGHPSVEQVYDTVKKDFPMTSLATVYTTIGVMKELGEVLELQFSRGANRYDGRNPHSHPHVICTGCGRILDPKVAGIDDLAHKVADSTGFRIETHRLDFYGLCPQCLPPDPDSPVFNRPYQRKPTDKPSTI